MLRIEPLFYTFMAFLIHSYIYPIFIIKKNIIKIFSPLMDKYLIANLGGNNLINSKSKIKNLIPNI